MLNGLFWKKGENTSICSFLCQQIPWWCYIVKTKCWYLKINKMLGYNNMRCDECVQTCDLMAESPQQPLAIQPSGQPWNILYIQKRTATIILWTIILTACSSWWQSSPARPHRDVSCRDWCDPASRITVFNNRILQCASYCTFKSHFHSCHVPLRCARASVFEHVQSLLTAVQFIHGSAHCLSVCIPRVFEEDLGLPSL